MLPPLLRTWPASIFFAKFKLSAKAWNDITAHICCDIFGLHVKHGKAIATDWFCIMRQVYAAASNRSALADFVELYARLTVQQQQQQRQRQQPAPPGTAVDLGMEVQQVVASAIAAAVEMGATTLATHLLRLLPPLGCTVVEEPQLGAAVEAAVAADVSTEALICRSV